MMEKRNAWMEGNVRKETQIKRNVYQTKVVPNMFEYERDLHGLYRESAKMG